MNWDAAANYLDNEGKLLRRRAELSTDAITKRDMLMVSYIFTKVAESIREGKRSNKDEAPKSRRRR
jgi:hypothetical protein